MTMTSSVILLQLVVGCLGLLISTATLFDAWRNYRTLRVSQTNGAKWILTIGDLLDEGSRVLLHLCIVIPTALFWVERLTYTWTWRAWVFMVMTVLLASSSLNSWVTRRKLLRHFRMTRME